ncbi:MAG: TonB-dependent receptor [Alphaproteobacteria bacterium]|nr:MAG: TonB-dependent receptor [Alphaproteobacteria bacterium]
MNRNILIKALLCSCMTLPMATAAHAMQESGSSTAATTATSGKGSVTGRVLDGGSNLGFQGAIVKLKELGIQATTDADGAFRFRDVPAGAYTLEVSYLGADTTSQQVTVRAGQATETSVTLAASVGTFEEILIVGQAARALNAMNLKRSAAVVSDSITSDSMGQFPDQNVSEAARRIAGVSVTNDQGEGRYVTIRGADPNLNAVSIDGIRMPSSETDQRQVALDVVASELLSGITVKKTVTPDMDGDAVGGTVEVKTFNAFSRDKSFLSATVEGSYNDLRGKVSPKAALSASRRFDVGDESELGLAIAGNYFDRKFGSHNSENGEGWDTVEFGGQEYEVPIEVSQRPYVIARERVGLVGNIDFRLGSHTDIYLHTIYSRFADNEARSSADFEFDDPEFISISDTGALANNGSFELSRATKDRTETQSVMSFDLGAKHTGTAWTVDYHGAYSKSKDRYVNLASKFEGDFDDDVAIGYTVSADNPHVLQITSNNNAAMYDASNYEADKFEYEDSHYYQRQWTFAGNAQYDFLAGDVPAFVKFGTKATLNRKVADETVTTYDDFEEDLLLSYPGISTDNLEYSLGDVAAMIDIPGLRDYFNANSSSIGINDEDTYIDSNAADFEIEENVYAGYMMAQADFEPVTIVAGLRVEHTRFSAFGNQLTVDEDAETLTISPVTARKTYTDYFPSINLKYQPDDAIVLRAAASRTIARPNFTDVAPVYERAIEDGELEGTFGNPDLDPYSSKNLDFSAEYYPGDLTMISFAAFYKDIRNFIVTADLAGTGEYEAFNKAITKINGESASLKGFEVSLQQQFSFLPAPFDGLLANINYTYADGQAHLDLGDRDLPLPNQSKHIFNASLGYEKDRLSMRLAVSYKDKYLAEILDPEDAAFDNYVDANISWDVTAGYEVTDNIKLSAKIANLGNRPFFSYFSDKSRLGQYETYGWTGSLGLTATF